MAFTRRAILLGTGAVIGAAGARFIGASTPDATGAELIRSVDAPGVMNDASGLSETPIHRHIIMSEDPGDALVSALRDTLAEAGVDGRAVNIGAARHSMGGQAIPQSGDAITFDNRWIEVDSDAQTYRVHAGARWRDVIAALDPLGLSPQIMQSNHDFGVAATFSVNAHGWPAPFGPMGASVISVGMVMADGSILRASHEENAEIFNAAMGGYGLIGLITDLELHAEPNRLLSPTFAEMPADTFAPAFMAAAEAGDVPMLYGRLNVDRARFFEDALLVTYRPVETDASLPAAVGSGWMSHLSRPVFRAQVHNEWVKRRRWWVEAGLGARFAGEATRNSLLNEPVMTLDDGDPTRTDILHEYFIPPQTFNAFTAACREIIPNSYQELLNITLRYVAADRESLLSYAPEPRIAAVLLFSQEMTARAEADMARMTQRLIDAVLVAGGSYYLPYRLHAEQDQFLRAYPQATRFAALKREVDPALRLRNALWHKHLERL